MKVGHRLPALLEIFAIGLLLVGCSTTNPATGERQFTAFMSPAQESRIGASEHPKIIQEFGGVYDDAEIGGYVAAIGGSLAANSEYAERSFTFTVLDSPIVNAFALPGGYVYVTRGLVATANSEAELAGVIAHEIGHVTARHSAERYSQGVMAAILGAGLGAVVGSPGVDQLFQTAAQGYLAAYSRDQELEADRLGVRYLARTGYDPFAMRDFLSTLEAEAELERKRAHADGPDPGTGFLATHPQTADRVVEAIRAAQVADTGSAIRRRDPFLDRIDGMLYGDSLEEGVVAGRTFSHPELRITFTAPPGFSIFNSREALIAKASSSAALRFDAAEDRPGLAMTDYVAQEWLKGFPLRMLEGLEVNGLEAATAEATVSGQSGPIVVRGVAYRGGEGAIYRLLFVAAPEPYEALQVELQRTTYSFRKLSLAEASAIRPLRLRVATVDEGDTIESLGAGTAFEDFSTERFRVLNGLRAGDPLVPGQRVKIVTREP